MVILDAMQKTAGVSILQSELNDRPGVCLKLFGSLGDVRAAAEAAADIAGQMHVPVVVDVIPAPDPGLPPAVEPPVDFNVLFEQATVQKPATLKKETTMADQSSFAVGLIETQGFTAVFEAIDTALKTAAVEVLAREKLGGGYITVVIKGDVAARPKSTALGILIAAHVIPSPSAGALALLPKS